MQHDTDEDDHQSDKVISANGNTLINRDNVLLPTTNETKFTKDKLTENIKDVSTHLIKQTNKQKSKYLVCVGGKQL